MPKLAMVYFLNAESLPRLAKGSRQMLFCLFMHLAGKYLAAHGVPVAVRHDELCAACGVNPLADSARSAISHAMTALRASYGLIDFQPGRHSRDAVSLVVPVGVVDILNPDRYVECDGGWTNRQLQLFNGLGRHGFSSMYMFHIARFEQAISPQSYWFMPMAKLAGRYHVSVSFVQQGLAGLVRLGVMIVNPGRYMVKAGSNGLGQCNRYFFKGWAGAEEKQRCFNELCTADPVLAQLARKYASKMVNYDSASNLEKVFSLLANYGEAKVAEVFDNVEEARSGSFKRSAQGIFSAITKDVDAALEQTLYGPLLKTIKERLHLPAMDSLAGTLGSLLADINGLDVVSSDEYPANSGRPRRLTPLALSPAMGMHSTIHPPQKPAKPMADSGIADLLVAGYRDAMARLRPSQGGMAGSGNPDMSTPHDPNSRAWVKFSMWLAACECAIAAGKLAEIPPVPQAELAVIADRLAFVKEWKTRLALFAVRDAGLALFQPKPEELRKLRPERLLKLMLAILDPSRYSAAPWLAPLLAQGPGPRAACFIVRRREADQQSGTMPTVEVIVCALRNKEAESLRQLLDQMEADKDLSPEKRGWIDIVSLAPKGNRSTPYKALERLERACAALGSFERIQAKDSSDGKAKCRLPAWLADGCCRICVDDLPDGGGKS